MSDKSLDERLKEDDWEVGYVIKNSDLHTEFPKVMADYHRGGIVDFMIIPANIARDGKEWLPIEPSHIVYIRRSDAMLRKIEEEKLIYHASPAWCVHIKTREEKYMLLD